MYEPTKFTATLWHPKDGVRKEVSVYLGVGFMPFSSDPTSVGVQFLVCDPAEGDKPLAMLFVEREEALDKLAHAAALHTHVAFARAFKVKIAEVAELEMR